VADVGAAELVCKMLVMKDGGMEVLTGWARRPKPGNDIVLPSRGIKLGKIEFGRV
jgi:hypothetical protein